MENWIAKAVGLMHINKITNKELAAKLGVTSEYISMLLNGKKSTKKAEKDILSAIDEIIEAKSSAAKSV